jgi:hypothetical protein
MHRYLFNYPANIYNNEQQFYELVPIPGSNITKAVLFAGHEGAVVPLPPHTTMRNTFLYLETNTPISTANKYKNLTLISQMVRLETGLAAEPVEVDIASMHNFEEVLEHFGSDEYYSPGVSFGGMVTHVGKTWHSLLEGLEQIDAAFDELMFDEEQ